MVIYHYQRAECGSLDSGEDSDHNGVGFLEISNYIISDAGCAFEEFVKQILLWHDHHIFSVHSYSYLSIVFQLSNHVECSPSYLYSMYYAYHHEDILTCFCVASSKP